MASKIKGISTLQLTEIDPVQLMKMNEKELRRVVSRMADAANKRVRRFEERGETSPAYRAAKEGGKFSTKGLNLNQLRAEYARTKRFLTGETGTAAKWHKVKADTISALNAKNVNITDAQFEDFWKAYEKLKEKDPSLSVEKFKYMATKEIASEMDGEPKNIDEIVDAVSKKLEEIYEKEQEALAQDHGVSSYITIK